MSNTGLKNFYYKTSTETERNSVAAVLVANGYTAAEVTADFNTAKVVLINKGAKVYSFVAKQPKGSIVVAITRIMTNTITSPKSNISLGRINGNYNAYTCTVTPKEVKVGCQTISFDFIEKVYKAVQKQKAED